MSLTLPHLVTDQQRKQLSHETIDTIIGYDGPPYLSPGPTQHNADVHAPVDKLNILGAIHWLLFFSKPHRHYTQATVFERFYPCIQHNSFRLYMAGDWPLAFINWAWVDDETDERLTDITEAIRMDQWASGKNLWMTEIVAPFGHGGDVMWNLQDLFRQGTPAKAVFATDDGQFRFLRKYYCDPAGAS